MLEVFAISTRVHGAEIMEPDPDEAQHVLAEEEKLKLHIYRHRRIGTVGPFFAHPFLALGPFFAHPFLP